MSAGLLAVLFPFHSVMMQKHCAMVVFHFFVTEELEFSSWF